VGHQLVLPQGRGKAKKQAVTELIDVIACSGVVGFDLTAVMKIRRSKATR
jgi:hypothetical protein